MIQYLFKGILYIIQLKSYAKSYYSPNLYRITI